MVLMSIRMLCMERESLEVTVKIQIKKKKRVAFALIFEGGWLWSFHSYYSCTTW